MFGVLKSPGAGEGGARVRVDRVLWALSLRASKDAEEGVSLGAR